MTGYDLFIAIVLVASALAGWVRGGTRELITLFSFILAAFIALVALPITAPIGRGLIDPDWAGSILAVVVSFFLLYFGIRIVGSTLSKQAQSHAVFGGIDSIVGFVIGGIRGLVLIGAIHLVVAAALPGEKTPRWLADAAMRPLSAAAAKMLQAVLPGIGRGMDALTPVVTSRVNEGLNDDQALPPPQTDNTSRPAASPE